MAGRSSPRPTLVWIDARQAIILRWRDGPRVARHTLDVPPHERSAGHVRLVPGRHGGGKSQTGLETHRLEHLRQDLARVAGALPTDEDLVVIGPGYVREHLAAELQATDEKSGRTRSVRSEAAPRMTERQLIERLRELVGDRPPRVRSTAARAPGDH